jgi:hypothetical protein
VFVGAVLWKLLPVATSLLRSWKAQSDTVTKAVPVALNAIAKIGDNLEKGFVRLNEKVYGRSEDHS